MSRARSDTRVVHAALTPTVGGGGEAEGVVAVEEAVPLPVAAQAGRQVGAAAAVARRRDGILHGAVGQPAGVAPVQAVLPRREQLLERGQRGLLVAARPLRPEEVEEVASFLGIVREHHAWMQGG